MPPQVIHLPDGQTFTVSPVFGGVGFRSHELNANHHHAFPVGWTIILHSEWDAPKDEIYGDDDMLDGEDERFKPQKKIKSFSKPTLQNDIMFISSISQPSSNEYKPATSPTRQIAMMLWVSLYWYFHQTQPSPYLETEASKLTPEKARPRGEWKVRIKRDGVLRGRNLIPKLERMGLIASEDTAVGTVIDDSGQGWQNMYVSKRMFWQIPGRLFLFTLQPNRSVASFPGSPASSRPSSPNRESSWRHSQNNSPHGHQRLDSDLPGGTIPTTMLSAPGTPIGPFYSTSHLPTYYPPPPLQYTFTNGIKHPLRPKPPRMGETFYTRFVPSIGQYLSFRVASISPKPVPHLGPVGPSSQENSHLTTMSDTALLQMWLSKPRVNEFWGDYTPNFLTAALNQKNSFPVIGLWDGVPFGYFEVYWVKEDRLGQVLGNDSEPWDRGLHVIIGEEWARGRVPIWLTGLVHWAFCVDYRTMNVCMEPRVDNERFLKRLQETGFSKEKQVSLPHKQSWYVRLQRDTWEGPQL